MDAGTRAECSETTVLREVQFRYRHSGSRAPPEFGNAFAFLPRDAMKRGRIAMRENEDGWGISEKNSARAEIGLGIFRET